MKNTKIELGEVRDTYTRAAVSRRVRRFMQAHPETKFVAISGTIMKRSLHDFGEPQKDPQQRKAPRR